MAVDPELRDRVLDATAEVYGARSVANASKRDIATRAGVPLRTVTAVGEHRIDLLRQVVEHLPFPPVAERMALQAAEPVEPAIQALLHAARDVLGDPATAWDPLELQALAMAPYDEETRAVVGARLGQRWEAAQAVVRQLRGDEATSTVDDDAATLHLLSVGLGLALLAPLSERWSDVRSWTSLTARLLEAVSDGSTVIVRLARPEDAGGVEDMHERASAQSRYQRYFTPMNEWREENLRRISGEHRGATLVVTDLDDQVIALGNVFPAGPESATEAEIALIVEDAWQGRGVGRILLGHLIEVARRLGFSALVAYVLADNRGMLRLLDGTDLGWKSSSAPDLGPSVVCRTAQL